MKRLFILFGLVFLMPASGAVVGLNDNLQPVVNIYSAGITRPVDGCKCKGISLHGRVRVVDHHADFLVRVVTSHADLHVKKVTSHPEGCGEWQFVDSHPDFTVQFVESHEDFSIRYVDHHPGRP